MRLIEEKDGLEIHSQKLAEEASYAKELAAAAAVELRNLAEEVTKLSYQNEKLTGDLAAAKELVRCRPGCCHRKNSFDGKLDQSNGARPDGLSKLEDEVLIEELRRELNARCQREGSLETALFEKNQVEGELQKRIDEAKRREEDLENELANMWVLVAKLRKSGIISEDMSLEKENTSDMSQTQNGFLSSNGNTNKMFEVHKNGGNTGDLNMLEEVRASYENERRRCKELERTISRLKVWVFYCLVKLIFLLYQHLNFTYFYIYSALFEEENFFLWSSWLHRILNSWISLCQELLSLSLSPHPPKVRER